MMGLSGRACAVAMAATLWFIPTFAGCAVGTSGYELPDIVTVREGMSKVEVYKRLGVPTEVFHGDDYTALIYTKQVQRGMALELRQGFSPLQIAHLGHSHQGTDAIMIVFDASDRVIKRDVADYDALAEYDIWPFGS